MLLPLLVAAEQAHGAQLSFGAGVGIAMVESRTQFKLTQQLGTRVSRGWFGTSLSLSLAESFGDGLVGFQVGPRLAWRGATRLGAFTFAYGPELQLGYSLFAPSGGEARHFFNLQAGVSLELHGGWTFIFFRPFGLDMHFADPFIMRYDVIGGLGWRF